MPDRSSICLGRYRKPYHPGEIVRGEVILEFFDDKYMHDLTIYLEGRMVVLFYQRDIDGRDRSEIRYSTRLNFYNKAKNLASDTLFKSGVYKFEFSFALNSECYTSCEGDYGHIRYELILVMSQNPRQCEKHIEPLTILRHYDFNVNRDVKEIQENSTHLSRSWLGCIRTCTSLFIRTNFKAYAPGQAIKYTLRIYKNASKKLENIHVSLIRRMTFIASKPTSKRLIHETPLAMCKCYDENSPYFNRRGVMIIPSTPPTFSSSGLIVEYVVRGEMYTGTRFKPYIRTEIGINIGTVPVILNFGEEYSDINIPTFMPDCMVTDFIDYRISAEDRITTFRPFYPVFEDSRNLPELLQPIFL